MKALPREMREPISLGYLLARASDTIADTASAPQELRLELMETFRKRVLEQHEGKGEEVFCQRLMKDILPYQDHDGESRLLANMPECFWLLREMDPANQHLVITVLEHIIKGQQWDVERFGDKDHHAFVETADELEQYTYWVAGSVGEFWTEVGYSNRGVNFSSESISEMKELGRKYGQGLQLVNVLRDIGEDTRNGRCYLPRDEFIQQGWNGEGSYPSDELLIKVSEKWREQCREWIHAGKQYAEHLTSRRVKFATVLPMLIAERTVELLEEAGPEMLSTRVKVSRREVRKMMARAIFY